MALNIYTINESDEWDKIIRSFSQYDVYWLSGYAKGFQIHGDGEALLFYYEDEETRGINVVMKRDVANDPKFMGKILADRYFDFASPYGYGGWIIEGTDKTKLFSEYEEWCKNNNIVSEFVRFHPVIRNHVNCVNEYDVVQLGDTVTMDLSSPQNIWGNLTSKNRNMIRKAQKNGVQIYNGRFPQIYNIFKKIYEETMSKDHADDYYYFETEYYESLLRDLPYNAQIFYAVYDGQVIAAAIILTANGYMNYHLSGSKKEYGPLAATNLLLYEVARWGSENGFRTLYLGGGVGSEEDSLFKFKKAFNRNDVVNKYFIGKKIYLGEAYNELLHTRESVNNNYFPQYRA